MKKRVLIVDLNNFARYPSIAIGYLTAVLRSGGFQVELLAPLSNSVGGVLRESPAPWWGLLHLGFRYRTGISRSRFVRSIRSRYSAYRASQLARSKHVIVSDFERRLDEGFDIVLVSTYLMYHPHCVAIGELCRDRGIPMLIGGPYFASADVAHQWIDTPGLSALVGGEVEPHLCEIVNRVIAGEPVAHLQGIWQQNGTLSLNAPPLADLDNLPFPDYSQFPWSKYPNAIVPIITGRGCGWGACVFCSDVTSTAGRTFRSRSPENVLAELAYQYSRHNARLFVFTDLMLNSNLAMWHALSEHMQSIVPDARWIAAVHVTKHGHHGLTLNELKRARAAGMVRLTTGFESGSQRILNRMAKGTDLEVTSQFLHDANEADISVRMTMFIGYPHEQAADIDRTTAFLEQHEHCIERLSHYRFQIVSGARFARHLEQHPEKFPTLNNFVTHHQQAVIEHHNTETEHREYRHAVMRFLRVMHRINRKPLRDAARDFEGVM